MSEDQIDLIDLAPQEYREQILAGELEVLPGQNPDKPVVRWASGTKKGQIVPGSGRFPRANDPGRMSKEVSYKRSKTYQQALELLMPIDGGEDKKGSFAWWYNQAMLAAEGSPQRVDCPSCGDRNVLVAFKKDGNLIFKLLELKHGKAKETQEINVQSQQLIEVMEQREVVVHVWDMNGDEEKARQRAIDTMIEGQFVEIDSPEEPASQV